MSIQDNNMGSESHSVRMPELPGPIHNTANTTTTTTATTESEPTLTSSQAEVFPTWSSGRSRASSNANNQTLDTTTSSDSNTQRRSVAYTEDTNTEPAGLSAYDHDKDTSMAPTPSSDRSRSRSTDYGTHRVSQDGKRSAYPDTESKHKKIIGKLMDHKLTPSFLK